ncbi:MAG: hypothetical protein C0501_30540 [Isosphaera sp.]|nr:hypothetical protein [Isosphaera sp.]
MDVVVRDQDLADGQFRRRIIVELGEDEAGWGPLRGELLEEATRVALGRADAEVPPDGFELRRRFVTASECRPAVRVDLVYRPAPDPAPSYYPRGRY